MALSTTQNLFHLVRPRSAKMRVHNSHDLSGYLISPNLGLQVGSSGIFR